MEGAAGIAWQTCCVAFSVGNVFLACLWLYGWWQSKLLFFALLSAAYVSFAFISIIVMVLAFDGALGDRILGASAYDQFRVWFFAIQPLVLLFSLVGYTMMIRWSLRQHSSQNV